MTTVAVILAAGAGTRFTAAEHKLVAQLGRRPVVEHAVANAVAAGVGPVVIVTGAIELPDSVTAMRGVRVIHNARWAEGQATSLQVAVDAASAARADAMLVGLGDQPFIPPAAWRAVAASHSPIAIATYGGLRRNPVRLHRSVWPLLPVQGDEGARVVIRLRPDLVDEVPCQGSPADIDTVEDLAQWQSSSSMNSP